MCVLVRVMDCLSLGCLYIGETLSGATVLRHHADSQTRELAKDDREGDETHTAVDGLMIVGGSTCTRSAVCECSQQGSRSQLLSRVLGDRRAHSGESGSGVDCPVVDRRGGRRPGVSAVCMYRFDGYGVYACH